MFDGQKVRSTVHEFLRTAINIEGNGYKPQYQHDGGIPPLPAINRKDSDRGKCCLGKIRPAESTYLKQVRDPEARANTVQH